MHDAMSTVFGVRVHALARMWVRWCLTFAFQILYQDVAAMSVLCYDNNQVRNPWISQARRTIPKTAQISNTRERTRKQRFNEVRPQCLRPRGNQREIILLWKIYYNGCSTSEYQESCYFRCYNKTLEIPFKYNKFLNQQSQPATRLSVDRAVDRAPSLCMLCTSVDRAGRPISCYCGRSTEYLLLLLTYFAACCFLRLSSTTSSTIPRRSLSTSSTISSLFPTCCAAENFVFVCYWYWGGCISVVWSLEACCSSEGMRFVLASAAWWYRNASILIS